MTSFSPAFKKSIEDRINNGTLKISGQSSRVPRKAINVAEVNKRIVGSQSMSNLQALGRLKDGEMNKTELAYSQYLEALKACGEVVWWKFEAIKLRLADNTHYTVDFFVMKSNGELEAHEVKGYMFDDANVKIKIAASIFPFRFFIARAKQKKDGGGFSIREV